MAKRLSALYRPTFRDRYTGSLARASNQSVDEVTPPSNVVAGRWPIVWLLFAASLINYLDRSSISMALPLLSKDLGLGPESKGLLLSAFFWLYALMQIPVGWAADRVNLRWLYFAAFVLWSVGQGLTGFAGSLGSADHVSYAARCGRVHLPAGRDQDCEHVVRAQRARPALRSVRLRHAHGPGARRPDHPLAAGPVGLAINVSADRVCRAVVGDPLAVGHQRTSWTSAPGRPRQPAIANSKYDGCSAIETLLVSASVSFASTTTGTCL